MGVRVVFRKLLGILDFAFGIIRIAAVPSIFVGIYSCLVVYLMVLAMVMGLGVFVWLVPALMLGPVIFAWYKMMQRRWQEYLASLIQSQSTKWDIEAALKGWVELTEAKRRRKKKG